MVLEGCASLSSPPEERSCAGMCATVINSAHWARAGRENPAAPRLAEAKSSPCRAKPGAQDIASKGQGEGKWVGFMGEPTSGCECLKCWNGGQGAGKEGHLGNTEPGSEGGKTSHWNVRKASQHMDFLPPVCPQR